MNNEVARTSTKYVILGYIMPAVTVPTSRNGCSSGATVRAIGGSRSSLLTSKAYLELLHG